MYLNDEIVQTNPSVPNDTVTYFTLNSIKPGTNYWTVKCVDGAGNTGSPYYISFVASYDYVYQSDDDGQNWTELDILKYLNPPLLGGGDNIENVYFMDSISSGKMFIAMTYSNHYNCDGKYSTSWYGHNSTFKRIIEECPKGETIHITGFPERVYNMEQLRLFLINMNLKSSSKKQKLKVLLEQSTKKTLGKDREKEAFTEVKYMPKAYISPAAMDIFLDYVYIFLWEEKPYVFMIKNKKIAESFKTYHQFLWKIAKP